MAKKTNFDLMDYDCDLTHRVLFLGSQKTSIGGDESGVDSALADRALKALLLMNKQAPAGDKPISVVLHNPGGDWYSGMAIYSAIKNSANPVTITVMGLAASMATIILQAADKRLMDKHASLMIHSGTSGFYGHSKAFISWAEEEKRITSIMHSIYMEKITEKSPKFTLKRLEEMLHFDTWLNAEEALALGLVDEII